MLRGEGDADCAWISPDTVFATITDHFFDRLLQSPGLQWVHSSGTGFDLPIFAALVSRGVRLTNSHAQAVGMADYVLWGVLDHFQGGKARAAEQAAHRWTKSRSREIGGTHWLIIGFGAVGEGVARRARSFDAHVTGVRRSGGTSPHADRMIMPDQLFDHLGNSDVVVLSVPQTNASINMVDAAFLAAMKPGSVLVNVGRGSAIDEDALLAALDSGTPEHALLDVFRVEPLPTDSRFWDHPRVTLTAHSSAVSSGAAARNDDLFRDNLVRYSAGDPLRNQVDPAEVLQTPPLQD